MGKEPPLMQEIGRKKYMEQVEKCNKFYDRYMAGKTNPKTGEYYNEVHYTDPSKPKFVYARGAVSGEDDTAGYIPCRNESCSNSVRVSTRSRGITCFCGTSYIWTEEDIELAKKISSKESPEDND